MKTILFSLLLCFTIGCAKKPAKYPELDAAARASHRSYRIWCGSLSLRHCTGVIFPENVWYIHNNEHDHSVVGGPTEADVAGQLTILAGKPFEILVEDDSEIKGPQ